jgi:hypothetical protein
MVDRLEEFCSVAYRFGIVVMAKYWCRFFDRNDQLLKAERMLASDDGRAITSARRAAPECTMRFEVWRNVNFVHEESMVAAYRPACEPRAVSSEWMIGTALSGIARLRARG